MSQAVADLKDQHTATPQRVIQPADAEMPALKYGQRLRLGMVVPSVTATQRLTSLRCCRTA